MNLYYKSSCIATTLGIGVCKINGERSSMTLSHCNTNRYTMPNIASATLNIIAKTMLDMPNGPINAVIVKITVAAMNTYSGIATPRKTLLSCCILTTRL